MSYFKRTRKPSREELRWEEHGDLVDVCAKHIATLKGEQQEIAVEALCMYMSIKVGDTKREEIIEGYHEALADAGVQV